MARTPPASIAAPDNGIGTIGVAPQAKIIAVKVLSGITGSGSFDGIIQGIVYAADHGADVINMSLGVRGGLPVNGPGANDICRTDQRDQARGAVRACAERHHHRLRRQRRPRPRP